MILISVFFSHFESAIRSCANSSDPLGPWIDYIAWVENTFPSLGGDGHHKTLVEKCIQEFRNNEKVNQDHRYLTIWIKYVG